MRLAVLVGGAFCIALSCSETQVSDDRVAWPDGPVPCNVNGLSVAFERAVMRSQGPLGLAFRYEARNVLTEPYDMLVIESRPERGLTPIIGPGSYRLDGSNLADCSVCVTLRTGCYGAWCSGMYLAGEGSIDIARLDSPGGRFQASLSSIGLRATRVDAATGVSTTGPDSVGWCIATQDIDVQVDAPGAQESCSPLGTGATLGEGIADFSLTRCDGSVFQLHDGCGGPGGMWFVATAGWCAACRERLPSVVARWRRDQQRGLDLMVVLGEDGAGRPPSIEYCQDYALATGVPIDHIAIDHGAFSPWQNLFSHISPYAGGGFITLPWNGLLRSENMAYTWTDAESSGSFEAALEEVLLP